MLERPAAHAAAPPQSQQQHDLEPLTSPLRTPQNIAIITVYSLILASLFFNLISLISLASYSAHTHLVLIIAAIAIERSAQALYHIYTSDPRIQPSTQNQEIINRLCFIDIYQYIRLLQSQIQDRSSNSATSRTSQTQVEAALRTHNVYASFSSCLSLLILSHAISMVHAPNGVFIIACILHITSLALSNTTLYLTDCFTLQFKLLFTKNLTCLIAVITFWALASNIARPLFIVAHFFASIAFLLLVFILSCYNSPNQPVKSPVTLPSSPSSSASTYSSSLPITAHVSSASNNNNNHTNNNKAQQSSSEHHDNHNNHNHQLKQQELDQQEDQSNQDANQENRHNTDDEESNNLPPPLRQSYENNNTIQQTITIENLSQHHSSGIHLNQRSQSSHTQNSEGNHTGIVGTLMQNKSNFFNANSASNSNLIINQHQQDEQVGEKPRLSTFAPMSVEDRKQELDIRAPSSSLQFAPQTTPVRYDEAARFLSDNNIQDYNSHHQQQQQTQANPITEIFPSVTQRMRNLPRVLVAQDMKDDNDQEIEPSGIVNIRSEPDITPASTTRARPVGNISFPIQADGTTNNNNNNNNNYSVDEKFIPKNTLNPTKRKSSLLQSHQTHQHQQQQQPQQQQSEQQQQQKRRLSLANLPTLTTENRFILYLKLVFFSLFLNVNYIDDIQFDTVSHINLQTPVSAFKAGNLIFMFIFDTAFNDFSSFFPGFKVIAFLAGIYYLINEFLYITNFKLEEQFLYEAYVYIRHSKPQQRQQQEQNQLHLPPSLPQSSAPLN